MSNLDLLSFEVTLLLIGFIIYFIKISLVEPYLYNMRILKTLLLDLIVISELLDKDAFVLASFDIWNEFKKSDVMLSLPDSLKNNIIWIYTRLYSRNQIGKIYFENLGINTRSAVKTKNGEMVELSIVLMRYAKEICEKISSTIEPLKKEIMKRQKNPYIRKIYTRLA
ncbi:MAG: hypothetical protein JRI56_10255 [Deltaproteobacteria bacterium]|nr:hypothetical protein [Deltaproteobacteria bacterium]